jgi:predicted double-glycine peptidase
MNRMYKLVAVLLVALIIGVTPAIAAEYSEITADTMAVKGKGADVASASELVEAVESRQATGAENETLTANVSGTNTTMSNDPMQDATFITSEPAVSTQNITMSDEPAPAEATGADTQLLDEGLDSVTSANEDTQDLNVNPENETIPQIDTSGIVMQSTDYSCGPAALATVLQNIGISVTEQELIVLADTDTSGTSMYGLVRAAHAKGLNAVGMKLSVDDLRPNNIVHIILDGEGHYSVVREVSENSVKLADPSLGNIEMTREEFAEVYTGNALVITDPTAIAQVNQTAEQDNNTTSTVQPENLTDKEMESIKGQSTIVTPETSQILTSEMMESIRGRWWEEVSKWGRYAWDQISAAGRYITDNFHKYTRPNPIAEVHWNMSGNNTTWSMSGNVSIYGIPAARAQQRGQIKRGQRRSRR